jgi:biopolymer transport protein ExbD
MLILRGGFLILLLAFAMLASPPSHARNFEELCSVDQQAKLVEIDLPIPQDAEMLGGYTGKITTTQFKIGKSGGLIWQGRPTNFETLPSILDRFSVEGDVEIQIYPDSKSQLRDVAKFVAVVKDKKFTSYGFIGNENYREIRKNDNLKIAKFCTYGEKSLTLSVFYTDRLPNENNPQCSVFLADRNLNNDELVDEGTAFLKKAIEDLGGFDAFEKGDVDEGDLPVFVIAAASGTPWECIGGVIFNMQMAGFLRLKLSTNASLVADPPLDPPPNPR